MSSGKLYIVPTPVGNLGDMSPRAIETLQKASLILAEDTRTSAPLMKRFDIRTPMSSHHKFNEHKDLSPILDRIAAGEDIALISDAGTPGISDPGFMLSRECRRRGLPVETLPGPTAFVPALGSSGLAFLAELPVTFIIYESPLRVARTLAELAAVCGAERNAAVCREISKLHETTVRDTLGALAESFGKNQTKGEIVIVVAPKERPDSEEKVHRNKYRTEDNLQI